MSISSSPAPINRSQTDALNQSSQISHDSANGADAQPSLTNTRYADTSRPGLVQSAKILLQIAHESFKVALGSEHRNASLERVAGLVKQVPQLTENLEKLSSLFSRISTPNRTQAQVISPTFSAQPPGSVEKLLQKPSFQDVKANAFDENAFVFNKGVASEPEQMRLMRATIESADKFAAVTTYGIKPIDRNGKVTNTMHSVLAGVAQRQHDPEFNFVFLYNKSVGLQNIVTGGKRTQVSLNPESTKQQQWPEVLDAYNKQALDEYNTAIDQGIVQGEKLNTPADFARVSADELKSLVKDGHLSGLPITDLKAKVYVVAADPGIGGSHHNKFAINDSGFAATLGASIGNTSKPSWFDSGAITLSQKLASSQRDFLLNTLLPQGKHIGQLKVDQGVSDVAAATQTNEAKTLRQSLQSTIGEIAIKDPFEGGNHALNEKLDAGLRSSGLLKPDEALSGHQAKVAWIQNTGSTLEPHEAKPIKQALEHLFKEAKPGDTLLLRNNAFNGTAQTLALDAIKRGVNVKILAPTRTKAHDAALLFKDIQALKNKVDVLPQNGSAGKLEVHVFNPSLTLRDAHEFDPGGRPVNDHAKVYALKRQDPSQPSLLLTGTHNLDGQSFKRSHENVMFMESTDTHLTDSLFDEFWDNTPEMTKQDIDLLVTDFKKPRSLPKAQWAEQLQGKEALLKKIGL